MMYYNEVNNINSVIDCIHGLKHKYRQGRSFSFNYHSQLQYFNLI